MNGFTVVSSGNVRAKPTKESKRSGGDIVIVEKYDKECTVTFRTSL